jgi:hypothetical protein
MAKNELRGQLSVDSTARKGFDLSLAVSHNSGISMVAFHRFDVF